MAAMRKQLIEYLEAPFQGRPGFLKWEPFFEKSRQTRASRTPRSCARTKARLVFAAPALVSAGFSFAKASFAGWDHEALVGAIKSLQSEALCKADLRRELTCGLPCPFERSRSPRSPSSAKAGFLGLCRGLCRVFGPQAGSSPRRACSTWRREARSSRSPRETFPLRFSPVLRSESLKPQVFSFIKSRGSVPNADVDAALGAIAKIGTAPT